MFKLHSEYKPTGDQSKAIDYLVKGMPVEQVRKVLAHIKIDTTMHYAMVNQNNVKISHRKYIG